MYKKRFILMAIITCCLSGCSWFQVYKLSFEQGNIITQKTVNKLNLGMSKEQVNFIMGSPVLSNPFSQDRWDYVYYKRNHNDERRMKDVSLYFKRNKLVKITGDVLPKKG